jgi:hypothetical protein
MQIKKLGSWLCIGLLPALILVSCTGNNKSELEQEAEKIDSNKSNIVSVGGTSHKNTWYTRKDVATD